jgi:prenyltransferase beta subunit
MAWRSNPERLSLPRSLAAVLTLCVLGVALPAWMAPPALAAAPSAYYQERLDKSVRYLEGVQNLDGGYSGEPGGRSEQDLSAWAALALAAAGINPQNQAKPGGADVYEYLAEHASELMRTTDFERELLVVDASGTSPYNFGGVDLVGAILARRLSAPGEQGAFTHTAGGSTPGVNDTIFAILALSPIQEPAVREVVEEAARWLVGVHDVGGGWPTEGVCAAHAAATNTCDNDVDMTGAAIEALNAAGLRETSAQREAFAYLHRAEDADGGFPQQLNEQEPEEPNVASTAWAVQAMWAAGENPETWVEDSAELTDEPLGYLASMQQEDGHIRYQASKEENGPWMTAQVGPALAGQSYPIPVPAPPAPTPPNQSSSGGGVIGGDGDGAPLFSRPQPQSRGATPGGVRLLVPTRKRAASKAATKGRREPDVNRASAAAAKRKAPAATRPSAAIRVQAPRRNPHSLRDARGAASSGSGAGGGGGGGEEVKGVLIGASATAQGQPGAKPGAPGLRGAGAGGSQTPWLAIAIGALIVALILTGSQLERRRPQVIL